MQRSFEPALLVAQNHVLSDYNYQYSNNTVIIAHEDCFVDAVFNEET